MSKEAVIYQIKNTNNGNKYIGSTNDKGKRWRYHKWALRNNQHKNEYLQKAWNKYGRDNFEFSVIETVESIDQLIDREQFYMNERNPEYNIKPKADRSELAEETKRKIGEAHKGREFSEETRKKISKANQGHEVSEKTREKLSRVNRGERHPLYGKERSKETKEKISKSHLGKELSEETKQKIAKAHEGKEVEITWGDKISEAKKGHKVSEETREKIRVGNQGKKLSVETKEKMSEAHRGGGGHAKLTNKKVKIIKYLLGGGKFIHKQIGKMFGVSQSTVDKISSERLWAHVEIEDCENNI